MILTGQILGVFGFIPMLKYVKQNLNMFLDNASHIKFYIVREVDSDLNYSHVTEGVNTDADNVPNYEFKSYQLTMLNETNRYRLSNNVSKVKLDKGLNRLAESYAKYMYWNHIFSHVDLEGKRVNQRAGFFGLMFKQYGENLAKINGDWQNLSDPYTYTVKSWEKSTEHAKNMRFAQWKYMGVGFYDGIGVQIFAY